MLDPIHSQNSVTRAETNDENVFLKTKDKGNLSLQKRNVTHVAKQGWYVTGHSRLLINAALARNASGHAPPRNQRNQRNQKKDCQSTRNANAVLTAEVNASANLPFKINVPLAKQGIASVLHKA